MTDKQYRTRPTERLTIREDIEMSLIKRALKLLLNDCSLSMNEEMSLIELCRKSK